MSMDSSLKAVSFLFLGFLFIAGIHPNFCSADSEVRCIESERQALLTFKQHLVDPSNRLTSWADDGDCCQWVGVVCHNLTGRVHELHLRSFPPSSDLITNYEYDAQVVAYERSAFGGKISPSLLDLKHLHYLDLSYNDFNGTQIPKFFGSLESLRFLNLSNAGFGSVIPFQLGNLSNLHYLNLNGYGLYAMNLQWLFSLPSLQHLHMNLVDLSRVSDWLQVINKLPSLLELQLFSCKLLSIPPTLSVNFSSLVTLDLSSNNFENTLIPSWVFGLHHLVSLDLSQNYFQGLIPTDLQNMTSLKHLDLSYNYFNYSIPSWLYSFSHLEFLNLGSNNLQGTVSNAIGNLSSIISIDLSNNEFGGKVPRSLGALCNLREIILSSNHWRQEISEILQSLSQCVSNELKSLYLNNAQFFGHLGDELGQLKNLIYLSFGSNSISGSLPMSLGNLSSLRLLRLSDNQFKGTLPQNFGQLSKLEHLYIESNMLEGVVSEVHFSNLMRLSRIFAFGNHLTLQVSHEWIPPFQLEILNLRSWKLGSKFPSWLCSQRYLMYLDISNTGISDVLPPSFWNLSFQSIPYQFLGYLNLSHNLIYGVIPNISMILSTCSEIDLSSNLFQGSLPSISSNVIVLDLSNNLFSGSISHFLCDKTNEPKKMEFLNLGKNLLSGKIPDCWMKWHNLVVLNIVNNNFTGSLPISIGSLTLRKFLHLYNNKFSGKLPSLKNCEELVILDIGENEFAGSIPSWIGHRCSSLMILSLRSNNFHGHLLEELCALTSLQILDLSHNKLSGRIPRCVKNFIAMATNNNSHHHVNFEPSEYFYGASLPLESVLLVIKGKALEYNTILRPIKSIDFSYNNLLGEILEEVTHLRGLQSLNLSYNLLIGSIPENIGKMESLESIDFSVNQFSGQIPSSMSSLTLLDHLNLSNNNLTGKIPSSAQLQSLNASSFMGNKLCGLPLNDTCTIDGVKPKNENHESKDKCGLEVDWFYVSMALGFVLGFWGVCGSLLLNKQRRIMYFQFLDHILYGHA